MKSLMRRGGLILVGLAAALAARADIIYVQGDVSGTWAADTVIVTGEVRVPPNQLLTIQADVRVLFQGPFKFSIESNATLGARGTPSDSIYFDELLPGTLWRGLRFSNASDNSRLAYCAIRHGCATGSSENGKGGGIYLYNSDIVIEHCTVEACSALSAGGGIYCYGSYPIIFSNRIANNATSATFGHGGGFYCTYSDPLILNNVFASNHAWGAYGDAGGVYFNGSARVIGNIISGNAAGSSAGGGGISYGYSPSSTIHGNIIVGNSVAFGGGIYCFDGGNAEISGNIIAFNGATVAGGIYVNTSLPLISDNIIVRNQAIASGGGIYCEGSSPLIIDNRIMANKTSGLYSRGGGINCYGGSNPQILLNLIVDDSSAYGGGVYCWSNSNPVLNKNSIAGNVGIVNGGGLYALASSPILVNSILWANSPQSVSLGSGGSAAAAYCDIQQSWPGIGNINSNPAFLGTSGDYRLLWGSPCIDTGDPDPIYNDPDGTRSDMGAFYYDQSTPIRILLTPHEIPYLIPESGGSMDYTIRAFNRDSLAHATRIWCDMTFPDSSIHGPVLGPVRVLLGAGALLERIRTQNIPAAAPMGVYHYNAYAVVGSDTSSDSFMWGKLGAGGLGLGAGSWTNTGEPITDVVGARRAGPTTGEGEARLAPTEYALHPCSPNPFNATTVARFEMRDASHVSLKVYDTAGKLIQILVDGWREAGVHQVTFDAADLPSGMYFCRIQARDFKAVQKMILLK